MIDYAVKFFLKLLKQSGFFLTDKFLKVWYKFKAIMCLFVCLFLALAVLLTVAQAIYN